MPTHLVNIGKAKMQLSSLFERAERGEHVVIARAGTPAVQLVKVERKGNRVSSVWAGRVYVPEDFDNVTDDDARDWYAAV